jgi:hypothetical protein
MKTNDLCCFALRVEQLIGLGKLHPASGYD